MRTLSWCVAATWMGLVLQPLTVAGDTAPAGVAKKVAAAEAALRKLDVSWERDHKRPGHPVTGIDFLGKPATDDALALLPAFPELESLGLYHSKVTAKGIAGLKKLPKLQALHLGTKMVLTNE